MALATMLHEVAAPERSGERAHQRMAEVRAALSADLTAIESALRAHAKDGPSPGSDAARHLLEAGGKRVRPMLVLLSAAGFGAITEAARDVAIVTELVHLSTLLHDDVIDDGDERRGSPTARRVYGNAISVLGGDLLLTHALERTARAAPALLPSLIRTLRTLVDGEIVQLRGRTRLDPDRETYFRVVHDKTASLFSWAAYAGARLGGASEELATEMRRFGESVGVAFQLVDDVLDFSGDPALTGKSLFADVAEGKLTLPLLLLLEREPQISTALARVRAGDEEAAREIAARVRASSAVAEAREHAEQHTRRALAALQVVPDERVRELLAVAFRDLAARAS